MWLEFEIVRGISFGFLENFREEVEVSKTVEFGGGRSKDVDLSVVVIGYLGFDRGGY